MCARTVSVVILFVLLFSACPSLAIDVSGNYFTRGIGSNDGSCGDYTTSEIMRKFVYENWLFGYISGVNHYRNGKTDFTNNVAAAGLIQWVANYCKENPLAAFSNAADALLQELEKRR